MAAVPSGPSLDSTPHYTQLTASQEVLSTIELVNSNEVHQADDKIRERLFKPLCHKLCFDCT
jgi:hypothetical protein